MPGRFIKSVCVVCALTLLAVAAGPATAQALQRPRPPNVVLILIDDLGWMDVGVQGSTFYETPHIDRLARAGVRFTQAYAASTVCSPSRASLLTGKSPARLGFTGHITPTGQHRRPASARIIPPQDLLYLRREETTLAEALKSAGYISANVGKWHVGTQGHLPEEQGFDVNIAGDTHGSPATFFYPYTKDNFSWNRALAGRLMFTSGGAGEYLTDRLTDEAVRFIEANSRRPFFLYLPHYAVHKPIEAPEDLTAKYRAKSRRDASQQNAGYAAMIESMDQSVGRVCETLRRLGLEENTILIFTSDNGGDAEITSNAPLRAGKGHLYEGGIRVPLIVRWPGRIKAGGVVDTPVSGADLYLTITRLAGAAGPEQNLDGRNLLPLLTGQGGRRGAELYWYYPHYSPHGNQPGAAIRAGDYKLIEHYDPAGVELYDLARDPGEQHDLAAKLPGKAASLRANLQQWLKRVGAQLHTNAPPPPRSASP